MFSPTDICVIVHRAKNLLIKGKGSNDAYATMEFEGEKYATNVVEKSNSPTWNQECQYALPQGGVLDKLTVTITVYNKQHGKFGLQNDDFIGLIKIPLKDIGINDHKEIRKWYNLEHKNPKKEKKQRGEVEIGLKFICKDRLSLLPDKKSPKNLRQITSKLGQKLRRRSEDEDSGVGSDSFSMRKGQSMDNLHRTPSSASDGARNKKRFSIADVNPVASARGLVKLSNRIGLGGNKKATSVEVLNKPEMRKVASASSLKRSSSGGRTDSGNNSLTTSAENLNKTGSSENIDFGQYENMDQLHASHNDNFSNSKSLNTLSTNTITTPSSLSIVYKPKSYYRLDVKELCKVSPIPEDPTATFQQMSREELLKLCIKQHNVLSSKSEQIRELEDYIDSLLVRVMVCTPQILDRSSKRSGSQRSTKF
uniref:rab11 family-interacting protein 2-like isoform X2 n=1 Tax=Styela clava TaxID=7725 RepID=UPI00193968FA|nr:rab11 family-interacting protein 2-like isoform X2 [Styela clava]